jgi:hypothetical protein
MDLVLQKWLFMIYGLFLVVISSLAIFYHVRWLGKLVTFFLNRYTWKRWRYHVRVESVKLALLSGTISFRNFRWYTENTAICILEGYVTFRYWKLHVRDTISSEDDDSQATRIHIYVNGFEWFIYNRTDAYERLRNILKPTTSKSDVLYNQSEDSFEMVTFSDEARQQQLSPMLNYLKWLPITIHCGKGAITVGHEHLEYLVIAKFSSAHGTESLTQVVTENNTMTSRYRINHVYNFKKLLVSFYENAEFVSSKLEPTMENLPKNSRSRDSFCKNRRSQAGGGESLLDERRTISSIQEFRKKSKSFPYFNHPTLDQDDSKRFLDATTIFQSASTGLSMESIINYDHLKAQDPTKEEDKEGKKSSSPLSTVPWWMIQPPEYARVNECIEAPSATLECRYEVLIGSAVEEEDRYQNEKTTEPELKTVLDLHLYDSTMNYGPWAERQRHRIMAFFFPSTFEDDEEPIASVVGAIHPKTLYKTFDLNFYFHGHSVYRIPVREFSQDWRYQSLPIKSWKARDFGWIDFKMDEASYIQFSIPLQPRHGQYEFRVGIDCHMTHVITSVNFAGFASWRHFHLQSRLCSPLIWNREHSWDFNIMIDDLQLGFLKDHLDLLMDLMNDWFWQTDQPSMEMHIPHIYNFRIQCFNTKISLYVNECNIIDFPDERTENSKFLIRCLSFFFLSYMCLPCL